MPLDAETREYLRREIDREARIEKARTDSRLKDSLRDRCLNMSASGYEALSLAVLATRARLIEEGFIPERDLFPHERDRLTHAA